MRRRKNHGHGGSAGSGGNGWHFGPGRTGGRKTGRRRRIAVTPTPTATTSGPAAGAGLSAAGIEEGRRLGRFTLVLRGERMAPQLSPGDLLIVDADEDAGAGEAVIVRTDAGGYSCLLLNSDGDAYDLAGGFLPAGSFAILGTVTGVYPAPNLRDPPER